MYFPDDLWRFILSFHIHKIKIHGKHLNFKNNQHITKYNNILKTLSVPKILPLGPCIVYCSRYKQPNLIKFVYCMPICRTNSYKLVIEYTSLDYYKKYIVDNNITLSLDDFIKEQYYKQYE